MRHGTRRMRRATHRGPRLRPLARPTPQLRTLRSSCRSNPLGRARRPSGRGKPSTKPRTGRLSLGRYQMAAAAFQSALDRSPDYVDALSGLGSAQFERANYEAALPSLEKALEGSRRALSAEPPEVTILRGKMAWSLYYLERHREALAMFIRASLAAPDSYQYQVGMGWSYLKLGQKDDARAAFRRAMNLGPTDEAAREGLRRAGI